MAKKRRRLKKQYRPYFFLLIVLLILIGIALMSLLSSFKYTDLNSYVNHTETISLDFGEGIICTEVGSYTGLFMEDGTDEAVSNVMRIVVKNTSEEDLQYAELSLVYDKEVREFSVSNLPSGESCVLLEKNRQALIESEPDDYVTEHAVFFNEAMSLMENLFEITGEDGVLNVKNISSKNVSGDVVVYYKYAVDDVYYGGITFRVRITGGIKSGEIRQIPAVHYDKESSVLSMVTCNE